MGKYYKISPEWAERLNLAEISTEHPDGWYMILPPRLLRLPSLLPPGDDGNLMTVDEAVTAIGGCIYDQEQVLASQRGEEAYMMNRSKKAMPLYNTDGTRYREPDEDTTATEDGTGTETPEESMEEETTEEAAEAGNEPEEGTLS